jgi:hypothetical protein
MVVKCTAHSKDLRERCSLVLDTTEVSFRYSVIGKSAINATRTNIRMSATECSTMMRFDPTLLTDIRGWPRLVVRRTRAEVLVQCGRPDILKPDRLAIVSETWSLNSRSVVHILEAIPYQATARSLRPLLAAFPKLNLAITSSSCVQGAEEGYEGPDLRANGAWCLREREAGYM